MPSKKRKYNARFPAGRIKKIMQTDEEVGKVAQAVPIIISRTLELFVESLLKKAMQVTLSRNAKTLSPSHVKQCILAESRFDFLRDLVKNIPDVSAAEEKELMSEENSPNTSRFPDSAAPAPPRRVTRQDSNSSNSSDMRVLSQTRDVTDDKRLPRTETATFTTLTPVVSGAIDLSKKNENRPNFYQETLLDEQRQGVIKLNPTYALTPQPSTSTFPPNLVEPTAVPMPKQNNQPLFHIDLSNTILNNNTSKVITPVAPVLNIDFSKSVAHPEIKVLDGALNKKKTVRQYARMPKPDAAKKETEVTTSVSKVPPIFTAPLDMDNLNSGNLQIDEDYDT